MYYALYQKRVYRVYQGGVYPDTADDPCPAALVAGYSDTRHTQRYTGMYRYSYTADTRYIPIQHPSDGGIAASTSMFTRGKGGT